MADGELHVNIEPDFDLTKFRAELKSALAQADAGVKIRPLITKKDVRAELKKAVAGVTESIEVATKFTRKEIAASLKEAVKGKPIDGVYLKPKFRASDVTAALREIRESPSIKATRIDFKAGLNLSRADLKKQLAAAQAALTAGRPLQVPANIFAVADPEALATSEAEIDEVARPRTASINAVLSQSTFSQFNRFEQLMRTVTRRTALLWVGWTVGVTAATTAAATAAIVAFGQVEQAANEASAKAAGQVLLDVKKLGLEGEAAAQEVGNRLAGLNDKLIKGAVAVSTQTVFSAKEAAQGYYFLVAAGIDVQKNFKLANQVLLETAKFAQAGGFGLEESTQLLIQASRSAGVELKNLSKLGDELVLADVRSTTTLEKLAQALANASGPAFKAYGQDVSETIAILQELGNTGFEGAKAGTAAAILIREVTRSFFGTNTRDADRAKAQREEFKKLGIQLTNTRGQLKPFTGTLTDLALKLDNIRKTKGAEAFAKTIQDLGITEKSSTSLRQLIPRIVDLERRSKSANDSVITLVESAEDLRSAKGFVNVAAQQQLRTLSGQFTLLKNNLTAFLISVGGRASKRLTGFLESLLNPRGQNNLLKQLAPAADKLKVALDRVAISFVNFVQSGRAADFIKEIGLSFRDTLIGVKLFAQEFSNAFSGGDKTKGFAEGVASIARGIGALTRDILPDFGRKLGQAFKVIKDNPELFKDIAKFAIAAYIALRAFRGIVIPLAKAFEGLAAGIGLAGAAFAAVLAISPRFRDTVLTNIRDTTKAFQGAFTILSNITKDPLSAIKFFSAQAAIVLLSPFEALLGVIADVEDTLNNLASFSVAGKEFNINPLPKSVASETRDGIKKLRREISKFRDETAGIGKKTGSGFGKGFAEGAKESSGLIGDTGRGAAKALGDCGKKQAEAIGKELRIAFRGEVSETQGQQIASIARLTGTSTAAIRQAVRAEINKSRASSGREQLSKVSIAPQEEFNAALGRVRGFVASYKGTVGALPAFTGNTVLGAAGEARKKSPELEAALRQTINASIPSPGQGFARGAEFIRSVFGGIKQTISGLGGFIKGITEQFADTRQEKRLARLTEQANKAIARLAPLVTKARASGVSIGANFVAGLITGVSQAGVRLSAILSAQLPAVIRAQTLSAMRAMAAAVVDGTAAAVEAARSARGQIRRAIAPNLKASGQAMMSSLLAGLKEGYGEVQTFIRGVTKWIVENKGPMAYDSVMLKPAGEAIMGGFLGGLRSGYGGVQAFVRDIGPQIEESVPDSVFLQRSADFLLNLKTQNDPYKAFADLIPQDVGAWAGEVDPELSFLHKTLSLRDTTQMAQKLAKLYGLAVTSVFRNYDTVAGPRVSDHTQGTAADISGAVSNTDRMAVGLKPLFGSIFKQLIWHNRDLNQGFFVPNHEDHMHIAWLKAAGFALNSGKLGKSALPTGTDPVRSGPYTQFFNAASSQYKISAQLLKSVARAESGLNPNAGSPAGAQGLMQLLRGTFSAQHVGNDIFDPRQNIFAGAKYLSTQLKHFGSVRLALAAYNAGPGAVQKYHGVPPFRETQEYVRRVLGYLAQAKHREKGGRTSLTQPYIVGEVGPELFIPDRPGQILSSDKLDRLLRALESGSGSKAGTMAPVNVNVHSNAADPRAVAAITASHLSGRLGMVIP